MNRMICCFFRSQKGGKNGKTRITVTTHFDGTEDATALFSELIALEMVELGKIISFPGSEKNALEKERESSYNDGVANNLNHVSGL